jgi:hypothetical protein
MREEERKEDIQNKEAEWKCAASGSTGMNSLRFLLFLLSFLLTTIPLLSFSLKSKRCDSSSMSCCLLSSSKPESEERHGQDACTHPTHSSEPRNLNNRNRCPRAKSYSYSGHEETERESEEEMKNMSLLVRMLV